MVSTISREENQFLFVTVYKCWEEDTFSSDIYVTNMFDGKKNCEQ